MRIVVVGAGAIGGVTAAYMAMGGMDVSLVCKRESTAQAIRENGLTICGKRGEHTVRMHAVWEPAQLSGMFDACLIATKAYDLIGAATAVLPYLAPDGLVVSLQNGICVDSLAEAVGTVRAAGAVVTWSCTQLTDTRMEITGEGGFALGMARGGEDPRLLPLKKALSLMAPTRITTDLLSELFSKLIINSGITCGGAMTGQTLGKLLSRKEAREFFIRIAQEDVAVANALGVRLPPFGGKLDYYQFVAGNGVFDRLRRHAVLMVVGFKYRKLKSSSLTALQRGAKSEADTLNGWISKKAKELGVNTPVNDAVVRVMNEIETGKRSIDPKNLCETLR